MKKNDFSENTRQSIFAIFLIIYKYIRIIFRQLLPLVLIVFIGGGSAKKDYLLYLVLGVGLFSMLWAIFSYFKFYFRIENNELIINKGILKKTRLVIPFDRVQSVSFQQNIIHQALNVVSLEIDTAGSKGKEFSFDALSKEEAYRLRDILLSGKSAGQESLSTPELVQKKPILQLEISDLVKIGISENHFKSGGLIVAGMFWIWQMLDDAGLDTDDYLESSYEEGLKAGFIMALFIVVTFLFLSFLYSLVRTVLNYYDLKLWQEGKKLKLSAGLLNKKEDSIVENKIQIIQWSDNLLKKLFGYFEVQIKQASSVSVSRKNAIKIPGCHEEQVDYLLHNWLGNNTMGNLVFYPISKWYLYRRIIYIVLFFISVGAVSYIFNQYILLAFAVLAIPYFIYTSFLKYKKTSYALNHEIIQINGGVFGDSKAILPLYKIQSIKVLQSPYQSRKSLASLRIYSASGSVQIPYIKKEIASDIFNYILYKTEIDTRSWM